MIGEKNTKPKSQFFSDLQEEIKTLNDGFDIQSMEMGILKNEMTDNLRPNVLLLQLVDCILQMLLEITEYEQKSRLNARMQASKERLTKMLEVATELSGIGDRIQSFKLFNRELVGKIQLLRVDNARLKNQVEMNEKTYQEL